MAVAPASNPLESLYEAPAASHPQLIHAEKSGNLSHAPEPVNDFAPPSHDIMVNKAQEIAESASDDKDSDVNEIENEIVQAA